MTTATLSDEQRKLHAVQRSRREEASDRQNRSAGKTGLDCIPLARVLARVDAVTIGGGCRRRSKRKRRTPVVSSTSLSAESASCSAENARHGFRRQSPPGRLLDVLDVVGRLRIRHCDPEYEAIASQSTAGALRNRPASGICLYTGICLYVRKLTCKSISQLGKGFALVGDFAAAQTEVWLTRHSSTNRSRQALLKVNGSLLRVA